MSSQCHGIPIPTRGRGRCGSPAHSSLLENAARAPRSPISGRLHPKLLFEELVKAPIVGIASICFGWTSAPSRPPTLQSNYKLAGGISDRSGGHFPRRNVHRIAGELAPERAAEHYAADIREFFGARRRRTAPLRYRAAGHGPGRAHREPFPGDPLIEDREGIAAAVFAPKAAAVAHDSASRQCCSRRVTRSFWFAARTKLTRSDAVSTTTTIRCAYRRKSSRIMAAVSPGFWMTPPAACCKTSRAS